MNGTEKILVQGGPRRKRRTSMSGSMNFRSFPYGRKRRGRGRHHSKSILLDDSVCQGGVAEAKKPWRRIRPFVFSFFLIFLILLIFLNRFEVGNHLFSLGFSKKTKPSRLAWSMDLQRKIIEMLRTSANFLCKSILQASREGFVFLEKPKENQWFPTSNRFKKIKRIKKIKKNKKTKGRIPPPRRLGFCHSALAFGAV